MTQEEAAIKTAMNAQKCPPLSGEGQPLINVWLVEDNETFRNTVARALARVPFLKCSRRYPNAEEALEALEEGVLPERHCCSMSNCPA